MGHFSSLVKQNCVACPAETRMRMRRKEASGTATRARVYLKRIRTLYKLCLYFSRKQSIAAKPITQLISIKSLSLSPFSPGAGGGRRKEEGREDNVCNAAFLCMEVF